MLIDLHVHSYLSRDCQLDPRAVLTRAESFGLDGVAFTETNTQDGCDELFDLQRTTKLKIFVGLELATDKGQYLCFFEKPERAPEPVQMWGSNRETPWKAEECLPKLKALGAAIIAARPYDKEYPTPALDYVKSLKLLSAVEVYNPKARAEIGYGATIFMKPIANQAELVKALLAGRDYFPVQMGELPHLQRPGAAREAELKAKKKKKRRWPR
jgi:predicted metal-dependent phosphoesterase TrpH